MELSIRSRSSVQAQLDEADPVISEHAKSERGEIHLGDEIAVAIYRHAYADKRGIGNLLQHLLSQIPLRKRDVSEREQQSMIKNRVSIDDRPEIADQKSRIEDWEGDTFIGKNYKGGWVTLAERKLRYVLAGHLRGKHAVIDTDVTTSFQDRHKDKYHIITFNYGREFAGDVSIVAEL